MDAQRLRQEAMAQIEDLTGGGSNVGAYDQPHVEAIMTDDGGPAAGACCTNSSR